MSLKSRIGLRVKLARQQKNITQAQLAERLDKAVETISNLERGMTLTGIDTLEQVAATLEVPIGFFFENAEDQRAISQARLELEEALLAVARRLRDADLKLAIALAEAVETAR